jgi:hypothetical protein
MEGQARHSSCEVASTRIRSRAQFKESVEAVMDRFLIDTDVIIDYLRGRERTVNFLEALQGELLVSVITIAELYSGIRGQEEERAIEQFLLAFSILPMDEKVARRGGYYRRDYGASHGTGLADSLIAASAEEANAVLVTSNRRHYPMLPDVQMPFMRKK